MEKCAVCGRQGEGRTIKRCSRCKTVRYCSTGCQSRDWPRHKVTCGESSVDGPMTGTADKCTQTSSPAPPSQPPSSTTTTTTTTSASTTTTTTPRPNPFASLFDGTFYRTPWQQARSRAQEAFPGQAVTDDLTADLDLTEQRMEMENPFPFSDLLLQFMPFPFNLMPGMSPLPARMHAICGKVLVLRLEHQLFVPPHLVWVAKDGKDKLIHVIFLMDAPANYFRVSDLQGGNFLCVKQAAITIQVQEWVSFIVLKDPQLVRVFKV